MRQAEAPVNPRVARAIFGEVDPVRRQKLQHKKEESRFHVWGNGLSYDFPGLEG
jgi:hypothetical protein